MNSLKLVFAVAKNSYKEIIRDRILYGILVFTVLLIGLSRVMGGLSFAEQERIIVDFGLAGVHISVVILSVFIGGSLVSKEFEKRTVLTLLVRPLERYQYICGKFIGFIAVIASLSIGLFAVLILITGAFENGFNFTMLYTLHGFILESLVLASLTIAFSIYSKPIISVSFVLGVFIIGHWLDNLNYFAKSSESKVFRFMAEISNYIFPNLELWNWKSQAVNREIVPFQQFLNANYNAIAWTGIFLCVAVLLFRKKDCA